MSARQWFIAVKNALPQQFVRHMERDFPNWKEDATLNPEDFKNRVRDYIDIHVGKSMDLMSISVYAAMDGKSEGEVYREFSENGY